MRFVGVVMVCVVMAFVLAACGGSEDSSGGSGGEGGSEQSVGGGGQNGEGGSGGEGGENSAAGEEQYARDQYTLTEDGAADDQYEDVTAPEDLPFPVPPDAEIVRAGESGEMAYGVLMNVPSGQEAYDFYIQSLPDAGFEILRDNRASQNEGENTNAGEGEGEGEGNDDRPFSASLLVEGNDLRGSIRMDEERVIVGMSAAAVEDAEAAAAEREANQTDEQTAGQNEE